MINKILILIILYFFTIYNKMIIKQYKLFDFYNINYFNFKQYLTKKELSYIYFILNNSPIELFNKTMENKRLSYISYSHTINNNIIKSGRLSIGSVMMPDLAFTYALDIINERNIIIPKYLLSNDYKFGGLGWDFIQNRFKIYFRCINDRFMNLKDVKQIIEYNKKIYNEDDEVNIYDIIDDYNDNKYWKEGIISFTYNNANNQEIEKKIYLYPKDKQKITYLISNIRGIIIQSDTNSYDDIFKTNNKEVKEIIDKYKNDKFYLDTYSKKDDNYILYFPK